MSLLPGQIIPASMPIGRLSPDGKSVLIDENWWLFIYNMYLNSVNAGVAKGFLTSFAKRTAAAVVPQRGDYDLSMLGDVDDTGWQNSFILQYSIADHLWHATPPSPGAVTSFGVIGSPRTGAVNPIVGDYSLWYGQLATTNNWLDDQTWRGANNYVAGTLEFGTAANRPTIFASVSDLVISDSQGANAIRIKAGQVIIYQASDNLLYSSNASEGLTACYEYDHSSNLTASRTGHAIGINNVTAGSWRRIATSFATAAMAGSVTLHVILSSSNFSLGSIVGDFTVHVSISGNGSGAQMSIQDANFKAGTAPRVRLVYKSGYFSVDVYIPAGVNAFIPYFRDGVGWANNYGLTPSTAGTPSVPVGATVTEWDFDSLGNCAYAAPIIGTSGTGFWVDLAGNAHGNVIVPSAASTPAVVSGTVYQNTSSSVLTLYMPVTYAPTAGAAATCAVALGSGAAPPTIFTESRPATAVTGEVATTVLRVPAGWYYSFTATNATLGAATGITGA